MCADGKPIYECPKCKMQFYLDRFYVCPRCWVKLQRTTAKSTARLFKL